VTLVGNPRFIYLGEIKPPIQVSEFKVVFLGDIYVSRTPICVITCVTHTQNKEPCMAFVLRVSKFKMFIDSSEK